VSPRSWRSSGAVDLAVCLALVAAFIPVTTQPDAPEGAGAGTVVDTLLLPLVALPILLRRRAPFAAAAALAIGCVVSGIPTFDQFRLGVAIPAGMLVLYSLGNRSEKRPALAGLLLVLAGMVFIGLTDVVIEGDVMAMVVFSFPLCIGTWAAGRIVRSRDQLAAELAERSQVLERRREETAQLAVEVERTRLASDLDAATSLRVREIIDSAEQGERALRSDPGRAQTAFAGIEQAGRDSLNELRGLLGFLRSDAPMSPAPAPAPAQTESLKSGGADLAARRRAGAERGAVLRVMTARWFDPGLAGAFALISLIYVLTRPELANSPSAGALAVLLCAPVAFRRTHPAVAACALAALLAAGGILEQAFPLETHMLVAAVVSYSCGAYCSPRAGVAGVGLLVAGYQVAVGFAEFPNVEIAFLTVGPWAVGVEIRKRRRLLEQLAERNREIEAQEEAFARLSVRQERARMARELHDIVAHHLAVIVVQASAGQVAAPGRADIAAEQFATIRDAGREALDEMARLVDILQADARDRDPRERMQLLFDQARAGGVDLVVSPLPDDVQIPSEIEDVAYRVVQEGLTNALKHAPGAQVHVRFRVTEEKLEVEVTNDPPDTKSTLAQTGSGMGLMGMRERVETLGGAVDAAPVGDGWRLRARLPLAPPVLATSRRESTAAAHPWE
jgi:signal transduction histidine kinase